MLLQKHSRATEKSKVPSGFTLVEVMVSVVLLGIIAAGVSYPYMSGLQALDIKEDRLLLDNHLRSRMEILVSTDFSALVDGSEVVSINGQNYTITWTAVDMDINGDAVLETNVKLVTVSVTEEPGRSLTMVLVDNEDRVGKIS